VEYLSWSSSSCSSYCTGPLTQDQILFAQHNWNSEHCHSTSKVKLFAWLVPNQCFNIREFGEIVNLDKLFKYIISY
jgi:hypothetical protein